MFSTRRKILSGMLLAGSAVVAGRLFLPAARNTSMLSIANADPNPSPLASLNTFNTGVSISSPATSGRLAGRHPDAFRYGEEQGVEVVDVQTPEVKPIADRDIRDSMPRQTIVTSKPPELILDDEQAFLLKNVVARLKRLQAYVGYSNFNIVSWDQALKYARYQSVIGAFEESEIVFIEQIFASDAAGLGFYGDKVVSNIAAPISRDRIVKVPKTGHFLFAGKPLETYQKIRKEVGDSVVLTSGIRNMVKQILLFLDKALQVDGNLTRASCSLAPPGYSYHAVGDFDIGKVGFGRRNFSVEFADTDEFKKLSDLGYINMRYPQNNPYGVRYEPWHIKVV